MKLNIIEEIKALEVEIGKRLFQEAKVLDLKRPPSPLQAKVLKYILEHKEKTIRQKDLEMSLKVSKATISEVLLTMEKGKIIKRVSVPEDARAKRIVLTNTSLERLKELEKNFEVINDELLYNISNEELAQFLNILKKMQQNMKERGETNVKVIKKFN